MRKTGGLADTVFDIDTSNQPLHERNGYTFGVADNQGVNWALDRALSCYINDRDRWHTLILNGIQRDLTWKHSVKNYLNTYELILRTPFLELPYSENNSQIGNKGC